MSTPLPPYQRIARDLHERIRRRQLQPGARLPSTRQLMRQYGVALATANKALTSLQQLGAIRSVPRVGYVVTAPEQGPKATSLSRERVVAAAIALADEQGLDAVSMRTLSSALRVPTMTLYGHVRDKAQLRAAMIDTVFGRTPLPAAPRSWRAALELAARTQWALFRAHPWLAQVVTLTRPLALPCVLAHAEWVLDALSGLGLDSVSMLHLHMLTYSYVRGLAINLESEMQATAETGMDEHAWGQAQVDAWRALAASGRYPRFAKLLDDTRAGYDFDLDAVFELGLGPLLDGFERWIAQRQGKATRRLT